jgi:DNA-binding NarL/FixJ family response regulator
MADSRTPSTSSAPSNGPSRVGDLAAMARILVKLQPQDEPLQRKRKLVAEFCRLVGEQLGHTTPAGHGLAPRLQQTLQRLLSGDSEKQIAARLGVSQHTVHVYVKGLYRHYDVSSRGELLARFVRPGGLAPEASEPTGQHA